MPYDFSMFDKKDKYDFSMFNEEDQYDFSMFNDKTSIWEDIKTGLVGAARPAIQAGYTMTGLLDTDSIPELDKERQQVLKDMEEWANPEKKEQSFGAKAISMGAGLVPGLITMPLSSFDTGQTLADAGESAGSQATGAILDTAGNVAGFGLPGMLGKTVVKKVLSGALINAGQDTAVRAGISAQAETPEAKRIFEPTMETAALAAIPGTGMGLIHAKLSKNTETNLENLKALVEREAKMAGPDDIQKQLLTERIKTAERTIKESPDVLEGLREKLKSVSKIKDPETRASMVKYVSEQIEGTEASIVAARKLVENFAEERGIPKETFTWEETLPDETTPNKPLEEGGTLPKEESPYTVEELPVEHIEVGPVKDDVEIITANRQAQKEVETPQERGPRIRNAASPEEEKMVMDILREFGLDKEDISIDLAAIIKNEQGDQMSGVARFNDDGTFTVGVTRNPGARNIKNLGIEGKEWFKNLNPPDLLRYMKAKVIAHEIGHILLDKIILTKIYNDKISVIVKDFDNWVAKNKLEDVTAVAGINIYDRRKLYYTRFSEYFAQRVFETMANPYKKHDVFTGYVKNMRAIWKALVVKYKLPINAFKDVDDIIKQVIADNKNMLDNTGKTLWEMQTNKRSIEDAKIFFGSLKKEAEHFDTPIVSPEELLASIRTNIDSPSIALKAINHIMSHAFGIDQKAGIWTNPATKYAVDVIRNSINTQTRRVSILLQGATDYTHSGRIWSLKRSESENSPKVLLNKASDADIHAVYKIFEENYGNDYKNTFEKNKNSLTLDQQKLFKSLANMFHKMGKMTGAERKPGWFPSIRQGDYQVTLHLKGAELVKEYSSTTGPILSNAVYVQRFFSKREAEAFLDWFENTPNKKGLYHSGVEERKPPSVNEDAMRSLEEQIQKILNSNAIYSKNLIEDLFKERAISGNIGGHHKYRQNLPGYKGSELGATVGYAGRSFREAIFNSVDEYTSYAMKNDIRNKLDILIKDSEFAAIQPTTHEIVKTMRDYAVNDYTNAFEGPEKFVNNLVDYYLHPTLLMKVLGKKNHSIYPQTHLSLSTIGKISRLFYISVLTMRPSFWMAQASQFFWAGRSVVKDGSGPLDGLFSMGKGIQTAAIQPEDFKLALIYVKENLHTFHPQFVNDLNTFHLLDFKEGSFMQYFSEVFTGEKPSAAADTFSRYMSFAIMYEHYKSKGLTGNALYEKAARTTDENMVQYGRQYKAPVFQKLGIFGTMLSPLQTFSQASLGNFIADFKQMVSTPVGRGKLKASMPLLATTIISVLMAGAIGAPMLAELELLISLYNWIADRFNSDRMPKLTELLLQGDNDFSQRVLTHGLLSAGTGFDMGSSLRWQPILGGILEGEKTFLEMLPALNWAWDEGAALGTLVRGTVDPLISEADKRTAAMTALPGYLKGVIDITKFNALNREIKPDMYGRAKVPQTGREVAASLLGTKTLESSINEKRMWLKKESEKKMSEIQRDIVQKLVDKIERKEDTTELVKRLATKHSMDGDAITNAIITEMYNRKVPEGVRQFVGKSGNMSNRQAISYQREREKYGVNPITGEEEE